MSEPPEKSPEFDAYARDYERLLHDPLRVKFSGENRFFVERKFQVIAAFLRSRRLQSQRMQWLDVGCGLGELLRMGRGAFASARGCDPAKEMLQACSDLDVRQQQSPLEIPFDSNSFDFVTAVCVYHHIAPEQRAAFTGEIVRVVRPGGILTLIEHNPMNPITRLIVSRSPIDRGTTLLSAGDCKRICREAGAGVVATRYFLLLPKPFYRRASRLEDAATRIPLGGQYAVFSQVSAAGRAR
jgi:SAM-dependent methyltransferase